MQRSLFGMAIGLAMVIASPTSTADELYQWKDANGVSHYSDSPPAQGVYTNRVITSGGRAQEVQLTAKAPTENAQCLTARKNSEVLQGQANVQQDTDGDGKPDKILSDTERLNQMEFARAALKAYCTPESAKP